MLNRSLPLQRGISMIEVAVAMTVMALLLASVAPEAGNWIRNMRIRSAAESIQSGIQRARIEAVRRNRPVTFWLVSAGASGDFDSACTRLASSASWVVSLGDPTGKCDVVVSETDDPIIIEKQAIGSNTSVTVSATESDGLSATNSLTFDGFGRVARLNVDDEPIARVTINNVSPGNNYRALRIDITEGGNVRSCDPLVSEQSDPRHC